ncbi:hypothetical protein ACOMHN_046116 [Nucella lapillus]
MSSAFGLWKVQASHSDTVSTVVLLIRGPGTIAGVSQSSFLWGLQSPTREESPVWKGSALPSPPPCHHLARAPWVRQPSAQQAGEDVYPIPIPTTTSTCGG